MIPANDDASKSISKVLEYVSSAIHEGLEDRNSAKDQEDSPAKEAVVEETPAKEAVVEETPAEEVVAEKASAEEKETKKKSKKAKK